jgi:hypothetical protein
VVIESSRRWMQVVGMGIGLGLGLRSHIGFACQNEVQFLITFCQASPKSNIEVLSHF